MHKDFGVEVTSRAKFVDRFCNRSRPLNMNCICISTPGKEYTDEKYYKLNAFTKSLQIQTRDDCNGLTPQQTEDIIKFIKDTLADDNITRLVIHCDAGMSRSVAIGSFIDNEINVKDSSDNEFTVIYWITNTDHHRNIGIYNDLRRYWYNLQSA